MTTRRGCRIRILMPVQGSRQLQARFVRLSGTDAIAFFLPSQRRAGDAGLDGWGSPGTLAHLRLRASGFVLDSSLPNTHTCAE